MTDEQKPKIEKLANLEVNRETIQDLTGEEAEAVQGGLSGRLTPAVLEGLRQAMLEDQK